jgi:hypothetical protein
MTKKKQGKQDQVTKAGAVELDENALDQISAGADDVVKIPTSPAPDLATSPLPNIGDQAATLLGHELTDVQQGRSAKQKKV